MIGIVTQVTFLSTFVMANSFSKFSKEYSPKSFLLLVLVAHQNNYTKSSFAKIATNFSKVQKYIFVCDFSTDKSFKMQKRNQSANRTGLRVLS